MPQAQATNIVTPAPIGQYNNPQVNQIYPIVNSVFEQMTGRTDIQAVDTNSLVAMGTVIQNQGLLDLWLNTMSRRIGYTIDGYRVYRNKFADLHRTQMQWGALVQKLTADMPEATFDKTYDIGLMDGQSVDHYIINNPKIHQRIFDKETPYSFFITMSTALLRDAFLSGSAMQSLISQIFGKVQNKIEFVLEELARIAVANFIINLKPAQHFHLVTMYNAETGNSITSAQALQDPTFLRYVVAIIDGVSDSMENMSVLYNSDGFDRFTPKANQRFYMLAPVMTRMRTVVDYAAYNKEDVALRPNIKLPYWQASGTNVNMSNWSTVSSVKGTDAKGNQVNLTNLVGVLFDYDAIGTFRQEEDVLTTPVNARARYYNTFWHEKQLWFNDMSENGVAFFFD